ncbi:GNAT family N-acetyltransferase [Aquabacterium sp.]|uniref:GNAT family N-acetyltransferase n=1 Tax=Aquabacterium sp. TaxID=1872578 RepID=UPI003BAE3F0F
MTLSRTTAPSYAHSDPSTFVSGRDSGSIASAQSAARSRRRSLEFVAVDQGVEMGMLSYEDRSDTALAFIYEIFVLPRFRERGVAAMLLSHAEAFAVRQRCQVVRL